MILFRKKIAGTSEAALARFVARARRAVGVHGQVDVLFTSSTEMRELNRRFRGKDKATDVLSFPSTAELARKFAGDLAISADMATENAHLLGHTPADEAKVLALHGLLHLAGYDHETDRGRMARREARLRRELRLPASLIERANGAAKRREKR